MEQSLQLASLPKIHILAKQHKYSLANSGNDITGKKVDVSKGACFNSYNHLATFFSLQPNLTKMLQCQFLHKACWSQIVKKAKWSNEGFFFNLIMWTTYHQIITIHNISRTDIYSPNRNNQLKEKQNYYQILKCPFPI